MKRSCFHSNQQLVFLLWLLCTCWLAVTRTSTLTDFNSTTVMGKCLLTSMVSRAAWSLQVAHCSDSSLQRLHVAEGRVRLELCDCLWRGKPMSLGSWLSYRCLSPCGTYWPLLFQEVLQLPVPSFEFWGEGRVLSSGMCFSCLAKPRFKDLQGMAWNPLSAQILTQKASCEELSRLSEPFRVICCIL